MNQFNTPSALYTFGIAKNVVWIEDIGVNTRSVTNDMEAVLNDIMRKTDINIADYKVVYKDSQGNWDGVTPHLNNDGKVIDVGFYPLRTRDKKTAILSAK
jgi:hypothetical protein